jgi:aminopeptidase N
VAEGTARLDLVRIDPNAPLILDAQALDIASVTGSSGGLRKFEIGPLDPKIGVALTIQLEPRDTAVTIHYSTTAGAEAMQWLAPSQTAGQKKPFVYTQGQAIYTRSWIPLQDSPGRAHHLRRDHPRAARTDAGDECRAARPAADGSWRFEMKQPIPSYLIALACGDLEFREISNRCGVWAERVVVGAAREELTDTETMVQSAEALFGPYRWERYDLIVLPPSFPYGGMENPRLTFATPTILAGDKSLVGLVAHELAHSWSGNLVTNATWRDFWLNEGFTTYFEQRIMEKVYGPERSNMEKVLDLRDLEQELPTLEPWARVLHVDLTGHNPDDAFSQVPYQKGALFLRRVEELVGRPEFDKFLRGWFDRHAFESVTTEDFLAYLQSELFSRHPDAGAKLDISLWMNGADIPADAPRPKSELLDQVDAQVARLKEGTPPEQLETGEWVTQQWLRFLDALPATISAEQMTALDRTFQFTRSGNSEILCAWLIKTVQARYAAADARLEEFLLNVGRRKYLKPLYTELAKTPEGLERARAIYAKARPRYHAVSVTTLDPILKWQS